MSLPPGLRCGDGDDNLRSRSREMWVGGLGCTIYYLDYAFTKGSISGKRATAPELVALPDNGAHRLPDDC